jgi:hypothetical protein
MQKLAIVLWWYGPASGNHQLVTTVIRNTLVQMKLLILFSTKMSDGGRVDFKTGMLLLIENQEGKAWKKPSNAAWIHPVRVILR